MTKRKPIDEHLPSGRPELYSDPAVLQTKIDEYFQQCRANEEPPRLTALAEHLDMHRDTLYDYGKKPKFCDIVKRAKQRVEDSFVKQVLTADRPTGAIFLLKANFGYTENIGLQHSSDPDNPPNIQVNFVNSHNKSDK